MPAKKQSTGKKKTTTKKTSTKKRTTPAPAHPSDAEFRGIGGWIMGAAAVLLFACLCLTKWMGNAGSLVRDSVYGLLGRAAFILPLLLLIGAFFYKKDYIQRAIGLKAFFGGLCGMFTAVLFHCGVQDDVEFITDGAMQSMSAWYQEGILSHGGGLIGGAAAWGLHFTGIAGTLILSITGLFLFFLFFIGMTPKSFIVTIQYYHYKYMERREEVRAAREPVKAARKEELAQKEAALVEMRRVAAERQRQQKEQQTAKKAVRRNGQIDANIYTDTYEAPLSELPLEQEIQSPEQERPATAESDGQLRRGEPVPMEIFDRGTMPGPAHGAEPITPAETAADAVIPDAEAYAKAEQDVQHAMQETAEVSGSMEAAQQPEKETIAAEPIVPVRENDGKAVVPTGEIDLGDIFTHAKDEELLRRYGPAAPLNGTADTQTAEVELQVTRSVPDGCAPEPKIAETIDFTEPVVRDTDTDMQETEATVPFPEEDLDDDAAALLASLHAVYGEKQEQLLEPAVQPVAEEPVYQYPPTTLLKKNPVQDIADITEELEENGEKLVNILRNFNVKTKIVNISRGPTVTRYELQPDAGTRVRSVTNLVDDIALGMAASGVRIEAPIPGKSAVGIEVPNQTVSTVYIRDLLECEAFQKAKSRLTTCLGMDVAGAPVYLDIAKMPHLLICGATGSGKSVCINSLILSILYKATPDEVKMLLIDPKKVEFNIYKEVPHLLVPVVSDPKKAAGSLHWAVTEMERRFELIEDVGMRDIKGYNEVTKNDPDREYLCHIVIIIDELADLMMTAPDDVEENICRIAQKARAAGMHLIIGTQRPSVDVITGLIKANVPSRIAFRVSGQMDSRIVLDTAGAEKLLGYGDMLYAPVGAPKPQRVQGAFVSETEIDNVVSFLKQYAGRAEYSDDVWESIEREAELCGQKKGAKSLDDAGDEDGFQEDPLLKKAIEVAVETGKMSTSLLQRRLSIGYGRGAKLIDRMEELGYISESEGGSKPRQVLISKSDYMEMVLAGTTPGSCDREEY